MLNVTLAIAQDGEALTLSNCVLRYDLREGLSELFELNVEVLLTDPAVDPLSIVGRELRFTSSDEPFHSQIRGIMRSLRQLSAEPTGGSRYEFMLPGVGDEVIVPYLDGDPDEPISIGRVHNAVYTSLLNLTSSDDFTVSMWKSCSSPKVRHAWKPARDSIAPIGPPTANALTRLVVDVSTLDLAILRFTLDASLTPQSPQDRSAIRASELGELARMVESAVGAPANSFVVKDLP